jgi:hypothetical protein
MIELVKIIKKKNIIILILPPQYLGQILRDNNITMKRTRHKHYPKEIYDKLTELKNKYLNIFY